MASASADIGAASRRRAKRDMSDYVKQLLATSVYSSEAREVDGSISFEGLQGLNIDVGTRILMVQAHSAMNGSLKSAEFLFKYAGYTPVQDHHLTVDTVQIIDDFTDPEMLPPGTVTVLPVVEEGEEDASPAIEPPRQPTITRPTKVLTSNPIMGVGSTKTKDDSGLGDLDWNMGG